MGQSIVQFSSFLNSPHNPPKPQLDRRWGTDRNQIELGGITIALLILALIGITLIPDTLWAATINAASCSSSDVQSAVNRASNGDTVVIPPCAQTNWSTMVTINVGITLQGAGIDVTVLGDNVPKVSGQHLMTWNVTAPATFRMTGMTIVGVATESQGANIGHLFFGGSAKGFRIDHVKWTNMTTSGMWITGDSYGLVDHISMTKNFNNGIVVDHSGWGGGIYGDNSWADPPNWGSIAAVYIEDSTFNDLSGGQGGAINDCDGGGRMVVRHNQIINDYIQSHGTDSSQRRRSCRLIEVYSNTFTNTLSRYTATYFRGGSMVIWDNDFNTNQSWQVQLPYFRATQVFPPWGICDGSSAYDGKQAGQAGYRCVDQPGAGTSNLLTDSDGIPQPVASVNNALDPIYIWGNRVNGVASNGVIGGNPAQVQSGRDFIVGTARPSYTPLTYPHPLVTSSGSTTLPPTPLNLSIR